MKRLSIILGLFAVVAWIAAQSFSFSDPAWIGALTAGSAPAAPTSYLLDETFETSPGYDTGSWAEGGTVSPDQSTTGLSLDDDECLALDSTSAADAYATSVDLGSSYGTIYGYCKFRFSALPDATGRSHITLRSGTTTVLTIQATSSGVLAVKHGGASSVSTVGTTSANTTYHLWFSYVKSTGADDGVGTVAFSTDGVRPTSGNNYAETTVGEGVADANNVRLWSDQSVGTGHIAYFDHLLLDNEQIGNSP